MYKNLGYTIKSIARIGFWVLLATVEIAGVIQIVRNFSYQYAFPSMLLSTLVVMAVAPGVLWLMSLALYTVGQMVENSDIRTDLAIKQAKGLAAGAVPPVPQPGYQANYQQPPYPQTYGSEQQPAEEPVPERTVYYPEDYRW